MLKQTVKTFLDYINQKKITKEIQRRIESNNLLIDASDAEKSDWAERIKLAKTCPDTIKIEVIPEAGTLEGDYLIMHNGLKILPLSYYGYPMLKLLLENKGIHEPQEEYVFQEVLKSIKSGSTMIELGAYWSFYSMWFQKKISGAKNFMIEPWEISHGIKNFKINKLKGNFFQYYVDEKPGIHHDGSKIISIDNFIHDQRINFVDILHSDIQGNEFKMLKGAENLINSRNVGYIFISTHSNELHNACHSHLKNKGYLELCSANMEETYSFDGLLVFKNPDYDGIETVEIAHKTN